MINKSSIIFFDITLLLCTDLPGTGDYPFPSTDNSDKRLFQYKRQGGDSVCRRFNSDLPIPAY